MTATDQLLARALHLAERRQMLLKQKASKAELDRATASLKMAIESLLLAYQDDARNSPWYTFAAIKREAELEDANGPYAAAQTASRHAHDIVRDASSVLAERGVGEAIGVGLFIMSVLDRRPIEWEHIEDPGQRIATRLRQLQYDLLNAGLPTIPLSDGNQKPAATELLLSNEQGGVHASWVEAWYRKVTDDGLDLPVIIAALNAWLPTIERLAMSPETVAARSAVVALEERVLLAAVERLPAELRAFINL